MNMENHQTKFNHEEWLEHFYRFIETGRQFCSELFIGLISISQKSLIEALKGFRSAVSRLKAQDFIITSLLTLTGMFGVMIFMAGLSLFGYQTILWLQNGVWTEFSLFVVFNFLFENTALQLWMTQPDSWVGLQKVFSWILETVPLSFALIIPGFSIALFMAGTLAVAVVYRYYQLQKNNG
ncbi:MAG TPA: hypothetical protein EYP95_05000 [Nitrospinaceae bacterium]|nr:hypothetical protein [Nitrospinaceae bacterium]